MRYKLKQGKNTYRVKNNTSVLLDKPPSKKIVVSSNKFLENKCVLTMREEKILLCVLAKINPYNDDLQPIKYTIKEFARLIGISDNSHTRIHQAAKALLDRGVDFINDDGAHISTKLMAEVKSDPGSGIIEFVIAPSLRKEFVELRKNFTQYELENILKLSNRYAIRLYEITKQYEKLGKRTIPIDKLRFFLGTGDLYTDFTNLERKVIKPSVDEVNDVTDLLLTYDKVKEGRSISQLEFFIESNIKIGDAEVLPSIEGVELAGKQLGGKSDIDKIDLKYYLEDTPERVINMILDYTDDHELKKLLLDFAQHCFYTSAPLSPPRLNQAFAILNSVADEYDDPAVVLEFQKSIINQSITYGKTFLYTLQQIKEHEDNLNELK